MFLLKKSISFVAILACLPAAYAATARPSVMGNAARRMPTMSTYVTGTTTSTTTTSNLLANAECIDAYTSCIKGADACGSGFEECTTKVLFHAKMPQCLSTLAQCSASGITSLFGTSNTTALSNVASKNTYGEVTDYTYPTNGSVLGQLIDGAAISNRYDTSNCVKRYTSCLKKENVCGADFELCTTNTEFKKQMVFCDSTLARCQSDGKIELFGSTTTTTTPAATSRIGQMISEGAALAAINAVSTCYKVVDQCILNACATNPYKCYENASTQTTALVDGINSGNADATTGATTTVADTVSTSAIAAYIKNSCMDTVGANKYCYATFLGNGAMPTASQLKDADNQEEVYDEAYAARMNTAMKAKITDLVEKFDTRAKQKCVDTIKTCAMRVCGGGNGAACYSQVFGATDKSINNSVSYNEIKTGCAAVVNTDLYCKYAAANPNTTGTYSYAYINADAFDTLFPEYQAGGTDPIGVIASLNATLANTYSDAAIAQMKKQCQSVATSCVKAMCGSDYVNCYRNRTDIYSNLTSTGDSSFDKSMNKVGGVLDYTVVLGLCLDTVKNASVCEQHLAIEQNKLKIQNKSGTGAWSDATSVRGGWIDAGGATSVTADTENVQSYDENGNAICTAKNGDQGVCNTVDENGNVYDTPVMVSYTTYLQTQAASSLFKDLIYDIEKEAQAKYNAKLTKEQNMCLSSNQGGVMGAKDTGGTYMWVKLKSTKVPKTYTVNGLKANQFVASNDLYGSFCRVRVTLQSDDKRIQEKLQNGTNWSTAYFAVGDSFTCGSWIPNSELEEIANAVADDATADKEASQKRTRTWMTVLGALGGTVGGAYLGASLQDGSAFGKLTGLNKVSDNQNTSEKALKLCQGYAKDAKVKTTDAEFDKSTYQIKAEAAISFASQLNVALKTRNSVSSAFSVLGNSCTGKDESGNENKKKCEDYNTALDQLSAACEIQADLASTSGNKSGAQSKTWIGSTVGAVAVGTAGAFLLNRATRDIQDSNMDAAQKAAYNEWMNSVGKHISCYVGGDEAGTYGDIITTSIE